MKTLAVLYNNLGVDILTTIQNIDRDENSGRACSKRRKRTINQNIDNNTTDYAEQKVDQALVYFQKALSLIVETTEDRQFHGKGLKYQPNDTDGLFSHKNETVARQLAESINPCTTELKLQGESGCSNAYIYCKAIKIGNSCVTNKNAFNEDRGNNSFCGGDFTRTLNEQDETHRKGERNPSVVRLTGCDKPTTSGGYDSLTKSIFHSMICIFNIALCYQYKGMKAKEKGMRLIALEYGSCDSFEIDALVGVSEFFLKASVDHYTRAYELMTRFRLENGPQYTLLMATMNNLAATYQSLEQAYKADVCNRYLVRSLILIICSSERDGHLGQEILSRSEQTETGALPEEFRNRSGVLSREEDRQCFESFLSNVTHLMIDGDQTYGGEVIASAA